MNRELAVKILKDMLGDYKDNNFSKDKEALEYAIKEIEKTAQEVPVQEQPVITIDIDESFVTGVNEKLMSIISELNELLEQTPKVVATSQSF